MKKRILGLVLVLTTLIISFAGTPVVNASTNFTEGDYTYTVTDNKATIVGCDWDLAGDVTLPSTLGGYPVTRIASCSIQGCEFLTGITVPDTVTIIEPDAFLGCENLTQIFIPESVTSISHYPEVAYCGDSDLFPGCGSLESILVSENNPVFSSADGVLFDKTKTTLYRYPEGKSNSSYAIPNGVTSIASFAFEYCHLINLFISDSVSTIDSWTFSTCYNLKSINVSENNFYFSSLNGVLFDKQMKVLLRYPSDKEGTSYQIPNNVTIIGEDAFDSCNLTNVTIPNGITSIGSHAFYCCYNLSAIHLPKSVISIGESAFSNCDSLISISVDEQNPAFVADGALFDKQKNTLIQYPIGNDAVFYSIPDGVTTIANGAFSGCKTLEQISFPNSLILIDKSAFSGCQKLNNVSIPHGVTTIASRAFFGCKELDQINLPLTLVIISDYMFGNCKNLKAISIPQGVTTIGKQAFWNCTSLTTLSLPVSINSIDHSAFSYCRNLTDVYYAGTEDEWATIEIKSSNYSLLDATIHYKKYIEASVVQNGNTYTIDTTFHNFDSVCTIIAAGYKDGILSDVITQPYPDAQDTLTLTGNFDMIQVMVWDNISTCKPLWPMKTITEW